METEKEMSGASAFFAVCMISPLGYTGIAYYDHSLCHHLSQLGTRVCLITVDKRVVGGLQPGYRVLPFFRRTFGTVPRPVKGVAYLMAMMKALFFIVKHRIPIVHFQILEFPPLDVIFFLLLRFFRKIVIYTPHDLVSLKEERLSPLQLLLYRLSNRIIVHNRTNSLFLIDECGIPVERISIIGHGNYNCFLSTGIDQAEARSRLALPAGEKIILFFGNIRPGKGLETLLAAYRSIKPNQKTLLLIAGKPSRDFDLHELQQAVKDGTNGHHPILLRDRFIPEDEVEYYFRAADVVAIPYRRGFESGVLRYAFSCGSAVIVSNLREFAESTVDRENCLVFRQGDVASLAEKLHELLHDDDLRGSISRNAKQYSDTNWDWDVSAAATSSLYASLSWRNEP